MNKCQPNLRKEEMPWKLTVSSIKNPSWKPACISQRSMEKKYEGAGWEGGDRGGREATTRRTRWEGYLGGVGGVSWGVRGIKEVQLEKRRMHREGEGGVKRLAREGERVGLLGGRGWVAGGTREGCGGDMQREPGVPTLPLVSFPASKTRLQPFLPLLHGFLSFLQALYGPVPPETCQATDSWSWISWNRYDTTYSVSDSIENRGDSTSSHGLSYFSRCLPRMGRQISVSLTLSHRYPSDSHFSGWGSIMRERRDYIKCYR